MRIRDLNPVIGAFLILAVVAAGWNARSQTLGGGGGVSQAQLDAAIAPLATNAALAAAQSTMVQQQGVIVPGNATKWVGSQLVADGGSLDQMTFVQPSSGFSNTIPNNVRFYIFGNSALLAAGTLTMPSAPVDGQRVTVSSRSVITLFTLNANTGQTLYGGLTSLGLSGFGTWVYRASDASWYRIG